MIMGCTQYTKGTTHLTIHGHQREESLLKKKKALIWMRTDNLSHHHKLDENFLRSSGRCRATAVLKQRKYIVKAR